MGDRNQAPLQLLGKTALLRNHSLMRGDFVMPSGRRVTKKSASSEVRPKLALPPETETANRKNFGLLRTVGRVHRLKDGKPKTTNLWDLTEIPTTLRKSIRKGGHRYRSKRIFCLERFNFGPKIERIGRASQTAKRFKICRHKRF